MTLDLEGFRANFAILLQSGNSNFVLSPYFLKLTTLLSVSNSELYSIRTLLSGRTTNSYTASKCICIQHGHCHFYLRQWNEVS